MNAESIGAGPSPSQTGDTQETPSLLPEIELRDHFGRRVTFKHRHPSFPRSAP